MKILLVDDDVELAQSVSNVLKTEGYHVEVATSGPDGLQLATNFGFDLLILDWRMPDLSGIEICRALRRQGDATPIIFLTGKDDYDSKEEGLDSGADDYLTKPFNTKELLARIRSVTRRTSGMVTSNEFKSGSFLLNEKSRTFSYKSLRLNLTAMETALISFLMRSGNPVSSQDIFRHVWPSDTDSNADTVRVHVRILRKKLELAGFPNAIARSSQGYYLDANL